MRLATVQATFERPARATRSRQTQPISASTVNVTASGHHTNSIMNATASRAQTPRAAENKMTTVKAT